MSFLNLHPDVRLGLLLVAAVLFLEAGSSTDLWSLLVTGEMDLSDLQYGLLSGAFALGSLSVVGAAIWVDRRPPHGLMAAGTGALFLGLALVTVADGFVMAGSGVFLSGVGGVFTGFLVFYSVAVKGSGRFRGTLIGVLALAFSVRFQDLAFAVGWGDWATSDQLTSQATLWWPMGLVLGAGVLLFLLLPRCFQGPDGLGPSLRETLAVPGAMGRFAWVAAVYLVAEVLLAAGWFHLRWASTMVGPVFRGPEFGFLDHALVGGVGALLWGIASDFFPVRQLLIVLAVLSLPAAAWGWLMNDPEGGALLLSLVRGGLISLPWVLMAEVLPVRHFAKLALGVTLVGWFGSGLGPIYWGPALDFWGVGAFVWIVLTEAGVLVAVAALRPRRYPVCPGAGPPPAR